MLVNASGRSAADTKPPYETLEAAGRLIADFYEIDETGQVFRYPEDRKGNPHLSEQERINLRVLHESMQRLHEFFDNWSMCLKAFLQSRDEVHREMQTTFGQ